MYPLRVLLATDPTSEPEPEGEGEPEPEGEPESVAVWVGGSIGIAVGIAIIVVAIILLVKYIKRRKAAQAELPKEQPHHVVIVGAPQEPPPKY